MGLAKADETTCLDGLSLTPMYAHAGLPGNVACTTCTFCRSKGALAWFDRAWLAGSVSNNIFRENEVIKILGFPANTGRLSSVNLRTTELNENAVPSLVKK